MSLTAISLYVRVVYVLSVRTAFIGFRRNCYALLLIRSYWTLIHLFEPFVFHWHLTKRKKSLRTTAIGFSQFRLINSSNRLQCQWLAIISDTDFIDSQNIQGKIHNKQEIIYRLTEHRLSFQLPDSTYQIFTPRYHVVI